MLSSGGEITGRASDKGDPRCRRMDGSPPRHLQVEASSATTQKTTSNELADRLADLPVAHADISVENRRCQLRDTIQSNVLDLLGRAHCPSPPTRLAMRLGAAVDAARRPTSKASHHMPIVGCLRELGAADKLIS
ncbi:unnamed protein product [Schistocephalus solidus]|uniref:Uncharacterized protein n=1 Tax=Schistocephalus solidus TaxID=70667 RepID=A0A183SG92_SCHSO|nr:unnamed protein product [Schistocephalus solidus]